jgi:hypothetical protein
MTTVREGPEGELLAYTVIFCPPPSPWKNVSIEQRFEAQGACTSFKWMKERRIWWRQTLHSNCSPDPVAILTMCIRTVFVSVL